MLAWGGGLCVIFHYRTDSRWGMLYIYISNLLITRVYCNVIKRLPQSLLPQPKPYLVARKTFPPIHILFIWRLSPNIGVDLWCLAMSLTRAFRPSSVTMSLPQPPAATAAAFLSASSFPPAISGNRCDSMHDSRQVCKRNQYTNNGGIG